MGSNLMKQKLFETFLGIGKIWITISSIKFVSGDL